MPEAKLKTSDREFPIGDGVTTVGRTSDNKVSFPDDSNVSRYHAEIESRDGEFCLIDLNSSNGTTVNDRKVTGEVYLENGDRIVLGGSSEMVFESEAASEPEAAPLTDPASHASVVSVTTASASPSTPAAASSDTSSGSRTMLMIAGGACVLALIFVVAAGAVYYATGSGSCDAKATIVKPENGDTLLEATDVEIEIKNGDCVAAAVYTIDGNAVARSDEAPFTVKIDPKDHGDLADGGDHALAVILIDADGKQLPQAGGPLLAFETKEIEKPEATPEIAMDEPPKNTGGKTDTAVTTAVIQKMSESLVGQYTGNFSYRVGNKQFLQEVQKMTAEYAQGGYFERASKYKDNINSAFVQENNLAAPLGFMLAMSRSKFIPAKQGGEEGIFRMNSAFVAANKYNGVCGTETLSDPSQKCASLVAAKYMKALMDGFKNDVIYSAAAFGKSTQDAVAWYSNLPADKSDIWNTIKPGPERDQLVRFFAAGIVAENPQVFGLKQDRPLSELYKLAM